MKHSARLRRIEERARNRGTSLLIVLPDDYCPASELGPNEVFGKDWHPDPNAARWGIQLPEDFEANNGDMTQ